MKNLGLVGFAIAALAVSGCGGGGSSTPTPAAVTATASPAATVGTLAVAYTDSFGVTGSAPTALGFLAATETATLTASQSNYTGSFTAASSCAQVTVAPATSTTGTFTATAVSPAASGCTITVTGATGTTAATLPVTVPTPGGVVMRWYGANYLNFSPPVPAPPGPVNLPGTGPLFAAYLAISEQNYIGGITAGNVVLSACVPAGAVVIAPVAAPTMLPTAAPGNTLLYYSVTGAAGSTTCLITATDSQTPTASSANVGVVVTGGSGTGN